MGQFITKEDEENILKLFLRTDLREGEKIVDNTVGAISKELVLNQANVSGFISSFLNKKYKNWSNETL